MKFHNKPILILIIILAVFLRFYQLDKIPSGLYVDEASIGYNAYSILLTGKDEYGKLFPIFMRSIGAFSSPLYVYLTIVPVFLFGLNIFAVRFLSALSGVVIVYLTYLLVKEADIFETEKYNLLTAILVAISPWNIFFSRGAYEANLALAMILLSLYKLTIFFKKQYLRRNESIRLYTVAMILLSLSTYTYQATRLTALLIYMLFIYIGVLNKGRSFLNKYWFPLLAFIIIQVPQLYLLTSLAFRFRASGLFYSDVISSQANKLVGVYPYNLSILLAFVREFLAQLSDYFSPKNLFWLGDTDIQRSLPGLSVFYTWMVIPYIVGLLYLLANFKIKKNLLICSFALMFVLPAALTRDPFSTLRSLPLSLIMITIIVLGIQKMFKSRLKNYWFAYLLVSILLSFIALWRSYYILFPKERAKVWGYGYNKLVDEIVQHKDTSYLIDEARMKPGYIQYLFFSGYDPVKFQQQFSEDLRNNYYSDLEFDLSYRIENVRFGAINWEDDIYKKQVLVGDGLSISEGQIKEHFLTKIFEIKDPLNETVFVAYETDPSKKCEMIDFNNKNCDSLK